MKSIFRAMVLLSLVVCQPIFAAPTKFLDQGGGLTLTADVDLALCTSLTNCGPVKRFANGAFFNCGTYMLTPPTGAPATGLICVRDPAPASPAPPAAPPAYSPACLPEIALPDFWNTLYETGPVPAGVSQYPNYVVWKGKASCGGAVDARLFTDHELRDFLRIKPKNDAEANDWGKVQTLTPDTAAETEFLKQLKLAYAAKIGAPAPVPPPPAPQYVVQRESATVVGTRPVYRLKADGTRNTTAVAGKRVNGLTPCDGAKRIGTTSYYSVYGRTFSDGSQITEDVYAVCVKTL